MSNAVLRILLVAGLVLLNSLAGGLRADEPSAPPASPAAPAAKPETTEPRDDNVLAEFVVAKDGDYLLLPVTIGADSYSFVIDTGSMPNIFGSHLHSLLGVPQETIKVRTAGNVQTLPTFSAPPSFVGPFPVHSDSPVVEMDLTMIEESIGNPIDGILGMDFLRKHVLDIDFDKGRLKFLKTAPSGSGTRISMLHNQRLVPFVVGKFNEAEVVTLDIDTGYNGSIIIDNSRFDRLARHGFIANIRSSLLTGPSEEMHAQQGTLSQFSLGKSTHLKQNVTVGDKKCLGLAYWSRYRVILSFPEQALYLSPGRRFGTADIYDLSGISLGRRQQQTFVHNVRSGSPAASADIRKGDVLLRIDDNAAGTLSLFELRAILATGGRKVDIQLERKAQRINALLHLPRRTEEATSGGH